MTKEKAMLHLYVGTMVKVEGRSETFHVVTPAEGKTTVREVLTKKVEAVDTNLLTVVPPTYIR